MGLFDHLFKSKSPASDEKVGEHAVEGNPKPADGGPPTPAPQKADPSAFLHPKNFVPRGASGLTPVPRPAGSGISKPSERKGPISTPPAADEIVLTLGDVLSRIPTGLLRPGMHDPKRELRFKINDLSSDIARGRAAVPLSRITQLAPDIFARQLGPHEDMEIRLPLQKLVDQIGLLRSRPKATAIIEKIETSMSPTATPDVPPAAKPVLPVEVKVEPKIEPQKVEPVAVPPAPIMVPAATEQALRVVVPPPPQAPTVVFAEPALVPKPIELTPAAEQVSAKPVVLGPPPVPVVEPSPVVEVPPVSKMPAPVAPTPAPESVPETVPLVSPTPPVAEVKEIAKPIESVPRVLDAKEVVAPVAPVAPAVPIMPAPESTASIPPKPAVPPPVVPVVPKPDAPGPKKIVIDWGTVAEKVEEKPDSKASEIEIGAPPVELVATKLVATEAVAEPSMPASEESPDVDGDEEKIHLSLAAILKHCPREILSGELPQVDDSVRITLPFAPIDRQLVKGQVEISALRFIVALPENFHQYFVAKIGVKVPIPLEEIFQNLPSPKQELTPVNLTLPPVVLAPAAPTASAAEVTSVSKLEELGTLHVPPIVPLKPSFASVAVKAEETAGTIGAKAVEPPAPAAPLEPPPLPVVAPEEPIKVEVPAAPSAAAALEQVKPAAAVEPILPPPDLPERFTAEQAAQPPVPTPADVTPAAVEPPPIPAVDTAVVPEPPVVIPATESTPPPAIRPSAVNAAPTGDEPSKLVLQPPVFRPRFVPPPRIFGFTPAAAASEPEQTAKVEPPSVFAGLAESPAPVAEIAASETSIVAAPEAEVSSATPSDAEPSAELIALAGEHGAPDIAHFSDEPVPFADLAESLAHETTYAPELAEVVHVDVPGATVEESKAPVAASTEVPTTGLPAPEKPVADEEHRAVPIVEGMAVAAVAATISEHVPLDFREEVPPIEESKAPEAVFLQPEPAKLVESRVEEPVATKRVSATASIEPPAAEVQAKEVSAAASVRPFKVVETPILQAPAAPAPEPSASASAAPPPPPHPLFPLPKKLPSEPANVEVLPPPSLPLRRFDQDAVQAIFMTEETLDLPKISRLAATLPGVYACVIATRDQACTGGTLPEGFDLAALLGLAPRVGEAAGRMPIGQLKHFTLYGEAYSVSFFERNGLSLCAVHRPRSFVPGVREKLVALADELSR